MYKYLVFILTLLFPFIVYSMHCPPPNEIVVKQGDKYVTLTPSGWRWTESWGGTPKFDSENVNLVYAMWDSERMYSEDGNRVHCIYGNPVFDGVHPGGLLQTTKIIDRSEVENNPNWQQFGSNYFRCNGPDVYKCLFGP
jgi:hypothetical protein